MKIMKNKVTFGKYKGKSSTDIVLNDPYYFKWAKKNVAQFKFSKRDYEMYLEFKYLSENNLQVVGYVNTNELLESLKRNLKLGFYDNYSDTEYLNKYTCLDYFNNVENHAYKRHIDYKSSYIIDKFEKYLINVINYYPKNRKELVELVSKYLMQYHYYSIAEIQASCGSIETSFINSYLLNRFITHNMNYGKEI